MSSTWKLQYPTNEDEILAFEDGCMAVTTGSAAQQDHLGCGYRRGTLEVTDDTAEQALPEDDNYEGVHPANVEDDDKMDTIYLYKAAE